MFLLDAACCYYDVVVIGAPRCRKRVIDFSFINIDQAAMRQRDGANEGCGPGHHHACVGGESLGLGEFSAVRQFIKETVTKAKAQVKMSLWLPRILEQLIQRKFLTGEELVVRCVAGRLPLRGCGLLQ